MAAAEELSVTPAAIGQQIRSLESWLGVPLFHRSNTGSQRLEPTEKSLLALAEIKLGFMHLNRGLRILRESTRQALTISASQAFVAKWLMARLESFTASRPNLEVRLDVTDRLVDFSERSADVGIRCGPGHWPNTTATKIMDEEVFPVCAPTLIPKPRRSDLQTLLQQTLIHDATVRGTSAFPSWDDWLGLMNASVSSNTRSIRINASAAAIQAAINGQGVALARKVLVHDDLAIGRLVRLFPDVCYPVRWAYYVVHAPDSGVSNYVAEFSSWMLNQAI